MSITDRTAARVYGYASGIHSHRPFPEKLRDIAEIVDEAFDELRVDAQALGLKVPGDDRAENVVHAMFRMMAEANGFDLNSIAAVLAATER